MKGSFQPIRPDPPRLGHCPNLLPLKGGVGEIVALIGQTH